MGLTQVRIYVFREMTVTGAFISQTLMFRTRINIGRFIEISTLLITLQKMVN